MALEGLQDVEVTSLLSAIARGEEIAIRLLYNKYSDLLYRFLKRLLQNDQDAEEVMVDVFMTVINKPHKFKYGAKFSTWLCAIAKHHAYDRLRARRKSDELAKMCEDCNAEPNWHLLEKIESREVANVIIRCLDALPAEQRMASYMAWYGEYSLADISTALQCSLGTVKSRLHLARKKVGTCIERQLPGTVEDGCV